MIHILVVDDDKNLNQTVCTYLNDCGFEAKGVLSANEAYDEMYNNLYELIISDIMMPEIDGFEFAETVRQVNKQIPILFMSAKDDLPSKRKGFLVGIDDYMVKPVELAELEMRVREKTLCRKGNCIIDCPHELCGPRKAPRAGGAKLHHQQVTLAGDAAVHARCGAA